MAPRRPPSELPRAGWREWVTLPDLGVAGIKAKLDTGARTSAIHAYEIERYRAGGRDRVRFTVHPLQRSDRRPAAARAVVLDERDIRSSSGQSQRRLVIETELTMGTAKWPIELTLASRDAMGFRLLLGRQALRGRVLVDAGASYLLSRDLKARMRGSRSPR